jgi:hypothetical protein
MTERDGRNMVLEMGTKTKANIGLLSATRMDRGPHKDCGGDPIGTGDSEGVLSATPSTDGGGEIKKESVFDWRMNDIFDPFDLDGLREALIAAVADALVVRYRQEHPAATPATRV